MEREREREGRSGSEGRTGYPYKKQESGEHREGDQGLTREDGKTGRLSLPGTRRRRSRIYMTTWETSALPDASR